MTSLENPAPENASNTLLEQHLQLHGVKAKTHFVNVSDNQLSETFLSYIEDNEHDLLVMGAYGHSRVREIVLGGMTRDMIRKSPVPVLMAH